MKVKTTMLILLSGLFLSNLQAQSIQEGMNHLYAERLKSAKAIFEKMVNSNPNNLEAVYWLGQTEIEMNDAASADALYSKTLQANGNAPLIMVGKGHTNLIAGKKDEAKSMFETAINLSSSSKKGPDPVILNAIGRANVDAKDGDALYAIEKLNLAVEKDPKNPEIFLNLGDAYRKVHEGGQAVTNYDKALQANPAANKALLARAVYRKGMIYYTQRNWEVYTPLMDKAIELDPTFAPAYYELYYYNLSKQPRNFNTAQEYATKFMANADPDPQNDYLRIQTIWAEGQESWNKYSAKTGGGGPGDSTQAIAKFQESIAAAKKLISTVGDQYVKPHPYRLIANSSISVKDTVTAKEYIDKFFAKAKEEDIEAKDYFLKGRIYGFSKEFDAAIEAYKKGTDLDSVYATKINNLIDEISFFSKQPGKKCLEGGLRYLLYQNRKNPSNTDLFNPAYSYYLCNNYPKAISILEEYNKIYPDSVYGYYLLGIINAIIDSNMTTGAAVPFYEKALKIAENDKVRFKTQGVKSVYYLSIYYANQKKDKAAAIAVLDRGLAFDPTNADFLRNKEVLQKAPAPKTPPGKSNSTGPKQSTGKATTVKKETKPATKK
jgi:tetratricopeptide (TPR) repeat protein